MNKAMHADLNFHLQLLCRSLKIFVGGISLYDPLGLVLCAFISGC